MSSYIKDLKEGKPILGRKNNNCREREFKKI
jgi:hypothetical protein